MPTADQHLEVDLPRLREICSAALASDCLDALGYTKQVLATDINLISGEGVAIGYAFPVRLEIVDAFPEVPYVGLLKALDAVGTNPIDINGRYEVVAHNVACEIDGVTINPGDLIVADIDGIVVVPKSQIAEVVRRVEEKNSGENLFRDAVKKGISPTEAFATFGVL